MSDTPGRLGIDLGGTKIEAVLLSDRGEVTFRHRLATPAGDYDGTLEAIRQLVDLSTDRNNLPPDLPVGIGTPGAISLKNGLMMNCNSTCLNGRPLREDLQTLLAREVRIANDADCFALSEASDGAGAGFDTVFGVILGTGVGGGIVHCGHLLRGVNAISGEWGHNTLALAAYQPLADDSRFEPQDRACYCGRHNCVETWLSGPGLERSFLEVSGSSLSATEIYQQADKGRHDALLVLDRYTNLLALALATVINLLDPGAIVFGGGVSNIEVLYRKLPEYLPRYVFSDSLNTKIVKATYGDSSGVRGAAWLWPPG